jgi:hypothetical protein
MPSIPDTSFARPARRISRAHNQTGATKRTAQAQFRGVRRAAGARGLLSLFRR